MNLACPLAAPQAMNESPSSKHYEPVQQQQQHQQHDDDDDDFHHIGIENNNDSDDKTAPTSNIQLRHEIHHLSFDLEDQEEDDEEEDEDETTLQRYQYLPKRMTPIAPKNSNFITTLWQMYLDARIEGRRQRASQLLENDDVHPWIIYVCSWCDLRENRGLLVFLTLIVGWIGLLLFASVNTKICVVFGIGLILRCCWRPTYWILWGRNQHRLRQEQQMAMYDELNGTITTNWK